MSRLSATRSLLLHLFDNNRTSMMLACNVWRQCAVADRNLKRRRITNSLIELAALPEGPGEVEVCHCRPEFWRVRDCWLDRHSGIGWWESPLHHCQIHSLLEVDVLMYISEWFDMQGGKQEHSKSWLHYLHSYTMLASYLYKLPYHYHSINPQRTTLVYLELLSGCGNLSIAGQTGQAQMLAICLYSHSSSNIRNTCALSIMSFRRRW